MSIPIYLTYSVITGCVATIAAALIGVSRALKRSNWSEEERGRTVRATAAVLIGWFVVAVVLALLGIYRGAGDRFPTIEIGIVIPILFGYLIIRRWSAVSRLIDATPWHWVIAVQSFRVEGVIFLILYASNSLPGLFALPAGVGDVVTGLLAAAIGARVVAGQQIRLRTALLWNVFGIIDLIVALATGFLTSPSPLQRFAFDQPNELISAFPLVLIPTFLVPLAILLHIISLLQLGRAAARDHGREHANPGVGGVRA
jgi:hypothetical protein